METTTKTIRYVNKQGWPIKLNISECNLHYTVMPGAPVKDRSGRCFNDPILDRFTGKSGLAREVGTESVPLLLFPRKSVDRPDPAQSSVGSAAGIKSTQHQGGAPVYDKAHQPAQPVVQPRENKVPYQGMSVAEARRRGFLTKKPRLVPEDYGADISNPGENGPIPEMRISQDRVLITSADQLPREMTDQPMTADSAKLITQLNAASKSDAVVSETMEGTVPKSDPGAGLDEGITIGTPAEATVTEATVKPVSVPSISNKVAALTSEAVTGGAGTPSVEEDPVDLDAPEGVLASSMPEPELPENSAPDISDPKKPFKSPKYNGQFQYRSDLMMHLDRKGEVDSDYRKEMEAQYPLTDKAKKFRASRAKGKRARAKSKKDAKVTA